MAREHPDGRGHERRERGYRKKGKDDDDDKKGRIKSHIERFRERLLRGKVDEARARIHHVKGIDVERVREGKEETKVLTRPKEITAVLS